MRQAQFFSPEKGILEKAQKDLINWWINRRKTHICFMAYCKQICKLSRRTLGNMFHSWSHCLVRFFPLQTVHVLTPQSFVLGKIFVLPQFYFHEMKRTCAIGTLATGTQRNWKSPLQMLLEPWNHNTALNKSLCHLQFEEIDVVWASFQNIVCFIKII